MDSTMARLDIKTAQNSAEKLTGGPATEPGILALAKANGQSPTLDAATGSDPMDMGPHYPGTDGTDANGGISPSFIIGSEGADTLTGGDEADDIFAGSGNDVLNGGKGDDLLAGEGGNDTLTGGEGNDLFSLQSGNDVITDFTPGEDTLDLTAIGISFDELSAEHTSAGLLVSWGENSVLLQGITTDIDEDWFYFMPQGNETGEPAMPWIDISIIEGTNGNDTLIGTNDSDDIFGGDGDDVLSGEDGADVLVGGPGADTLTGGADADVFIIDPLSSADVITDFTAGEDYIDLTSAALSFDDLTAVQQTAGLLITWDGGSLLLEGVTDDMDEGWFYFRDAQSELPGWDTDFAGEPIVFPGGDTQPAGEPILNILTGTDNADTLTGTDEPDYISGGGGNDILSGAGGQDILDGGAGDDTLTGGADDDIFVIGPDGGNYTITDFTAGEDLIDMMGTGLEFDNLSASQSSAGLLVSWEGGSLLLEGVSGELDESWFALFDGSWEDVDGGLTDPGFEIAVQEGTDQADDIVGGDNTDFLYGNGGDDALDGKGGSDILDGGAGDDTLTGGKGFDSFQFGENSGNDTITDFTPGQDIISFDKIGLEYDDLSASNTNAGLMISWDGGSVLLAGITETVDENWFNFVGNIVGDVYMDF